MKAKFILLLLFSLYTTISQADGQYGCVTNVSGGYNWSNSEWKLVHGKKNNILIKIEKNGNKLIYKEAGDQFEIEYKCTKEIVYGIIEADKTILSCSQATSLLVFDEANKIGGMANIMGAINTNRKYRDSMYLNQFTCQKF